LHIGPAANILVCGEQITRIPQEWLYLHIGWPYRIGPIGGNAVENTENKDEKSIFKDF
jgi:hypothetical protein